MHELGLLDSIIRTVDRIIKEEKLTVVEKIVLEVGELSGVVPHFLNECYPAVVSDTPYQDTKLELLIVHGTAQCNDCAVEVNIDKEELCCPLCQGKNLTPITGKDLVIKRIEAY